MKRRGFLAAMAVMPAMMGASPRQALAAAAPIGPDHPLQAAWAAWKALCLAPEGRIIDAYQEGASHSEGQGYGLTLAAAFGDLDAAARIIDWTENNLALRRDSLLAWRWLPGASPPVKDRNNASDGDLFYAWGMVLAHAQDPRPAYLERATRIASDLTQHCIAEHPDGSGQPLLLPGAAGFLRAEGVVLNPSYYMPRALREVGAATGNLRLVQLAEAGVSLANGLAARGPVPDWLLMTAQGAAPPPEGFSARSGYEAVRVPLFGLWSDLATAPCVQVFARAEAEAGAVGGTATVFDPLSRSVIERSTHAGYAALAGLAGCAANDGVGASMPLFAADQPYYPATLHLMALLVQATIYQRCVPL